MKYIWMMLALFVNGIFAQNYQNNFQNLIENTTWIVPPSTLQAYQYSTSSYTSVTDQTVWIIDNYDGGFFFGTSYTAIITPPCSITSYTQAKLIGTVTNGGNVYITFIPSGGVGPNDLVNGIGVFTELQGSYCFVMQMNSGSSTTGTSHWSYMISINENSPYYNNLPGVDQSLPDFLSNF